MKSSAVLCSPYGGVEETQRRVFDVVVSGLPFRFLLVLINTNYRKLA